MESAAAHTYFLRRQSAVTSGFFQGSDDEFLLGVTHREILRSGATGFPTSPQAWIADLDGQVPSSDLLTAAENHGMFDRRAQLAHIAGPLIPAQ